MTPTMLKPVRLPVSDFETTARAVLAFLHQRFGLGLWMITRTKGDDWVVLQTEDHGYNIPPGTVLRWSDSFCSRMVQGLGPQVAPNAQAVPAYASAPIGQHVRIQAYIGLPLRLADGALFGTLCAIDPEPQPEALRDEEGLLNQFADLLSTILQMELAADQARHQTAHLQLEALTDPMTGLYNRRAWDKSLADEEERCRRYGHHALVMVVDLDGLKQVNDNEGHAAGDALIARAAAVLRHASRGQDVVARLGGDEFGVLCAGCNRHAGEALQARLHAALQAAGVPASLGHAARQPGEGLCAAWALADARMYQMKRGR